MKAIVKPASMEDLFRWIMIFFLLKLMKTGIKMLSTGLQMYKAFCGSRESCVREVIREPIRT